MKRFILVALCAVILATSICGCDFGEDKQDDGRETEAVINPEETSESTPSPLTTAQPTALPTEEPTAEPTPVPTIEPTPLPTIKPTARPTAEPTPTPKPLNEGETVVKLTKENVLKYFNIKYDYGYSKVTLYKDRIRDPEDMPWYEIVDDGTWYYELSPVNPDDRFNNAMVLLETRHLPPFQLYLYPEYKGRVFFSGKIRKGTDIIKPSDFGKYVASYKIISAKGSVITKDVR